MWSWQGNDGSWLPYTSGVSALIERGYARGAHEVPLDAMPTSSGQAIHSRVVDLKTMTQINLRTRGTRSVRRENAAPPPNGASPVIWEWQDEYLTWRKYDDSIAAQLEDAPRGSKYVTVTIHHVAYDIDLANMVQVNTRSGMKRSVRRQGPPRHGALSSQAASSGAHQHSASGGGTPPFPTGVAASPPDSELWHWLDESGGWQPFDQQASQEIAKAATAGQRGCQLRIGRWDYRIDFTTLEQTNTYSGAIRSVVPPSRKAPGVLGSAANGLAAGGKAISNAAAGATGAIGGVIGGAFGAVADAFGGGAPGAGRPSPPSPPHRPSPPPRLTPPTRLPWTAHFTAASQVADLKQLTKWRVLKPGEWPEEATDPVMFTSLGEDGEEVVRLPCHTEVGAAHPIPPFSARPRPSPSPLAVLTAPGPTASGHLVHLQPLDDRGRLCVQELLSRLQHPLRTERSAAKRHDARTPRSARALRGPRARRHHHH